MGLPYTIKKPTFIIDDEEETFDEFTDALTAELEEVNTCTHPSSPVTFIDLPEPQSVSSEFFYNFYTRDERTIFTNNTSFVSTHTSNQEVAFLKRQARAPRNAILEIKVPPPPRENEVENILREYAGIHGSTILTEYKDQVVFEGAVANTRFSSLILKDNRVDKTFYKELTGSISFDDAYTKSDNHSQFMMELARKFFSPLASATQTTSTIKRALSNVQPSGVAYAPTDTRFEAIAESLRDVNFVEFNMTMGNSVINNIVQGSLEDRGNIYHDELLSVEKQAGDIQSVYVSQVHGYEILSSEYDLELAPLFTMTKDQNPDLDESHWPIGLYIEKSEIVHDPENPDVPTTRIMNPIIIPKYAPVVIFDPNIKYGATYVYKVKIVYLVCYEANAVDPDGLTPDEIVYAFSAIASEGVMTQVAAIERIPPSPPRNLTFNYNFSENNLDIYWEEPYNPQRDAMRYQIFRRKSINEPFVLVGELDFDMSTSRVVPLETAPEDLHHKVHGPRKYFKDSTFKRSDRYIYALASVDARGLTSGYSEQVEVSFNRYDNKLERKRISDPNAPKSYPNLYLRNDFFVDAMTSSGASRLRIYFDPEYYKLQKTEGGGSGGSSGGSGKGGGIGGAAVTPQPVIRNLDLIGEKYKLQIINLDLQNSEILEIDVNDISSTVAEVPMGDAEIKSIIV